MRQFRSLSGTVLTAYRQKEVALEEKATYQGWCAIIPHDFDLFPTKVQIRAEKLLILPLNKS